jgi:AmmeMemoRadiSam system protein B/AmmeMemoRadiSam system protein A
LKVRVNGAANMKKYLNKYNLSAVILYLCIFGMFFVTSCKKSPVGTKETKEAPSNKRTETEHAGSTRSEQASSQPRAEGKVVLHSSLAGQWYPADAEALSKQIAEFFQKADVTPKDNVIALILPHAGYAYSGQTAACGLKTAGKQYKRIIVIGPSHYYPMQETLTVPRVTHYETPLGQVPLDVEFINQLRQYPMFQSVPQVHQHEHSVQIELPLLQHCQKDFKFVPIVAGSCSLETISKAGEIIRGLISEDTLVIASSDFTHYGPNYSYVPFTENVPEQLKKLDMGAYEHIAQLDTAGLLDYRRKTGATICGYVPITILLSMLDKTAKAELVKYATSGELMGDFSNSVSYLAVAFSGKWISDSTVVKPHIDTSTLTAQDKKQLLTMARETILFALSHQKAPQESDLSATITDAMRQPRAAFVTLKKHGELRGCIGDILPRQPLYKSVIANAINACVNDRRFSPVTVAECNDITIEISALTVPQEVASSADIRIGIDGVILQKGDRSAVFLPQVAPEQGWDLQTTLSHLSMKAGLPADAWKEGATFLTFQADVFGEEK